MVKFQPPSNDEFFFPFPTYHFTYLKDKRPQQKNQDYEGYGTGCKPVCTAQNFDCSGVTILHNQWTATNGSTCNLCSESFSILPTLSTRQRCPMRVSRLFSSFPILEKVSQVLEHLKLPADQRMTLKCCTHHHVNLSFNAVLEINPRSLCILDKHSTLLTVSPAPQNHRIQRHHQHGKHQSPCLSREAKSSVLPV